MYGLRRCGADLDCPGGTVNAERMQGHFKCGKIDIAIGGRNGQTLMVERRQIDRDAAGKPIAEKRFAAFADRNIVIAVVCLCIIAAPAFRQVLFDHQIVRFAFVKCDWFLVIRKDHFRYAL